MKSAVLMHHSFSGMMNFIGSATYDVDQNDRTFSLKLRHTDCNVRALRPVFNGFLFLCDYLCLFVLLSFHVVAFLLFRGKNLNGFHTSVTFVFSSHLACGKFAANQHLYLIAYTFNLNTVSGLLITS